MSDGTRKVYIRTFGCQMNEYDSAKMADVLGETQGLTVTADLNEADVVLFNTCSVREHAEERVFSWVGELKRVKRERPELVVGSVMFALAPPEAVLKDDPYGAGALKDPYR